MAHLNRWKDRAPMINLGRLLVGLLSALLICGTVSTASADS
jgi:hypothetical protein